MDPDFEDNTVFLVWCDTCQDWTEELYYSKFCGEHLCCSVCDTGIIKVIRNKGEK